MRSFARGRAHNRTNGWRAMVVDSRLPTVAERFYGSLVAAVLVVVAVTGCPAPDDDVDAGDAGEPDPTPEDYCPGSPLCELSDGPVTIGAAKKAFTPTGYEIANVNYLKKPGDSPDCAPETGLSRCGELNIDILVDDCGNDAICSWDENYVAPDVDGSQGDGVSDYFKDCGKDRICPGDVEYVAADADGTEGDEVFQGLWIAGYGNNRPAMGTKDDLWARAIVISQGDTTVAMVAVDSVGLFYDLHDRITDLIEAERPGAIDLLVIQSTHTHEAPDTLGQWGLEDPYAGLQIGHGRSDEMMDALMNAARDAVVEAYDDKVEAKAFAATIDTGITGFLRDSRDPMIFNTTLTAVRFTELDGVSTICTIVNWGNHPEILDDQNNFISSDYLHAVRVAMEDGLAETNAYPAHAGLGGVAIYQQGTVGGLMGPNGFDFVGRDGVTYPNENKTFTRADRYGELLADKAFVALASATEIDLDDLRFSSHTFETEVANQVYHVGLLNGWFDREVFRFDRNEAIVAGNFPWLRTRVSYVSVGPLRWLTAPGEMFPETWVGFGTAFHGTPVIDPENVDPPNLAEAPDGPYLESIAGGTLPMLLGLAHDEIGYLVPPYDFQLDETSPWIEDAPGDHYEETNSCGPDVVPTLLENYQILFDFEASR